MLNIMLFISLFGLSYSSSVYLQGNILCNDDIKGDLICDPGCMQIESNFDSAVTLENPVDMMLRSDCYNNCISSGCTQDLLKNGICDDECNNIFCGWDASDCGYCNSDCTISLLTNNQPDDECNTNYCIYDNEQFGWCAPGCFYSDFVSNEIKIACNVSECSYQNQIALYNYLPGRCNQVLLKNGFCDDICDNEEFDYDNGDCLCAPGCLPEILEGGDCSLDNPCANENCNYVGGKCLKCDDACFESNVGDGTCQSECNSEKCQYDGGDCGCAIGCNSTYINGEWNMIGDCEFACLAPSCLFNYKVCNDLELLSAAIMYSFVFDTYSDPFEIKDSENCPLDVLKSFSKEDNFEATSFCNNENCLYCKGYVKNTVTDCVRFGDNRCFLYNSTSYFTIFSYPISISHPLKNISTTVPELNEMMNGLIYFVKEGSFSKQYPNIITVSDELSFYEAMYITLSPYATIRFGEGTFALNFSNNQYIYQSYLHDISSPLFIFFEFPFYELTIEGMGPDKTIVEFLDNIALDVLYETIYLKNIKFSGELLLNNDCNSSNCYYCPYYSVTISDLWVNDRNEIIEDHSEYAVNCGVNSRTQFTFRNDAYVSNVVFYNFQNQAENLIRSYGTLSLENVIFEKIQQKESQATILQTCTFSSCFFKTLTLKDVQVIDLNYGYEHIDTTLQSYFLKTSQIGDILFNNVTFEYAMSISCLDCTSTAVLIFENIQGQIQILDSEFRSMYITKLIEIITDNLVYSTEALSQIEKSKQKIYSMNHLFINNTKFYNIFAQEGLIYYNMKNIKQNIKISYSHFKQIASLNFGLLLAISKASSNYVENFGKITYIVLEKGRTIIEISPRLIHFFELEIEDISCGYNFIEFTNMPHIKFEEIRVKNLKSNSGDDPYTYAINKFVKGGKKLSIAPDSSLVQANELSTFLYSASSNNVIITGLTVIDIESSNLAFSVLDIELCDQIEIKDLNMSNITTQTYSGSVLKIYYIRYFIASNLNLNDISNEYFSIFNLMNVLSLSILNVSLNSINTNFKAAFLLSNVGIATLSNFKVFGIQSKVSKGTLFDIFLAPPPLNLHISDITIDYCSNLKGRALLLYLDSISPDIPFDFMVENVLITNSFSNDGYIYFDYNVNFKESKILNFEMINCTSDGSAIIDHHNQGLLIFENLIINHFFAENCGITAVYSTGNHLLSITDSIIKNSRCNQNALFIQGAGESIISADNLTLFNVNSTDPLILLFALKFVVNNSDFNSLISEYIVYSMYSEIEINNTVYENCESNLLFLLFSVISCSNCTFKDSNGTVLSLGQSSSCYITESLFENLFSDSSGFLVSSESHPLIFSNCKFQNSHSQSANFFIENSDLNFFNCTVNDNDSNVKIFFALSYSGIFINNSVFFNQPYSFIFAGDDSVITIQWSYFSQNITNFIKITSNLEENRQALKAVLNEGFNSGIRIFGASLTIKDSTFNGIFGRFGAVIYAGLSEIDITSSYFINCANSESQSGIIHSSDGSSFKVKNSFFYSSLTETSFIKTQRTNNFEISGSSFYNNANDYGSSIYLEGSSENYLNAYITMCYFYNNSASAYGGAVYSSLMNLIIDNSIFNLNKANEKGGGIYFESGECKECKLIFNGYNTFMLNSSPNGSGGAIKWLGTPPEIIGTVHYSNNSALYGSDNAAYPVKLKFESGRELLEIDNFRPGSVFKSVLKICLADDYSNIVNSAEFDKTEGILSNVGDFIVSEVTSFNSYSGCFDLTGFSISGKVGTMGNISFYSKNIEDLSKTYGLSKNQANAYINISIVLRNCSYGEQNLIKQCSYCKASKYLIDSADSCLDCPTGAECLGGYLMLPKKGYWKLDRYSNQLYKCPVTEACLGSKNISDTIDIEYLNIEDDSVDYSGTCLSGYEGNLCGSCVIGYSKSSNGKCSKCPNPSVNILIITLFLVLIVLVAYIMVTSTLKSAFSVKSLHSIYIKIFTNYLQIIFLTTEFNMNWPSYVLELFSIQRSAASSSDQLYSIDCFFSEKSDSTAEDIYFYKILLATLLPPIIWLISFFVWLIISFYKENIHYLKQEVYTTIIVLFFLIHPNIVKTIFSSFSCMEIQRSGHWLNQNLQIRCWSAFHKRIILTMSLPGVILWVFGVPLVILVVMIKRFRFLGKDQNKVIFGFIYNGYKRKKFFWEFVILYRKILIISISVFMVGTSTSIQALTVVILLLAALYFQFSQHPYTHKQLNLMETQALFTATLTIYCGLYYITAGLNDPVKNVLFIGIVLGNAYFIIFWIYYMFQAILEILVKVFPIVKKYLKRGDYFEKAIFEESLQMKGVFVDKTESTKNFTFFKPVFSKLEKTLEGVNCMESLYIARMNIKFKKEDDNPDLHIDS